jgi:hypothetical protein
MERVCRDGDGLFPAPREIKMSCSCPDGANMCKHVAASLYGVGARLDTAPELLFALRGVDSADLISSVDAGATTPRTSALGERILAADEVAALFGIEMSPEPTQAAAQPREARKQAERMKSEPKLAKTAKASGGKAAVRDETPKAVREKPVASKAQVSKAQVSETHEAKSARRRSAAPVRTAEPAPVKAAASLTKRRSARLDTSAAKSPATPTQAEAKARTRIEKSARRQSKKPPQAGAPIAEPAATKKPFGAGAGAKPVAPAGEENALKATTVARNAKSTKPASAAVPAVEQNEPPIRRRGRAPAGRTRAAKWISARAKKNRV